jgi:hypothetical protein
MMVVPPYTNNHLLRSIPVSNTIPPLTISALHHQHYHQHYRRPIHHTHLLIFIIPVHFVQTLIHTHQQYLHFHHLLLQLLFRQIRL